MAKFRSALLLSWACFSVGMACAGEFAVKPIRLELGAAVKSGVISVRNEGQEKLSFQLQAMQWTQDDSGKDQYADTNDLIFFPKIMTVEPGQEAFVRIGARTPVVPVEKTYRLFIEELPGATKPPETGGPQVSFLIRFGAPIFVAPLKPQDGLEITALELAKGVVNLRAKNTGNRHQVVQGIDFRGSDANGKEVFAFTVTDRYLLTGTTKSFTTSIAAGQCARIASLAVNLKTDRLSVDRKLDVSAVMCL
jgi:fimbrial chaperone protein